MEINEKLLLLERKYIEYTDKSVLTKYKQKNMTFYEYASIVFLEGSSIFTEEEESIEECILG
ncbi:MAG: hypothetical protein ACOC1K_05440 [Nanoarchaeota archaeon]